MAFDMFYQFYTTLSPMLESPPLAPREEYENCSLTSF